MAITPRTGSRQHDALDRREALQRLMAVAVAPVVPSLEQAAGKHPISQPQDSALGAALPADPSLEAGDWKPKFFDDHQNQTLIVLSDLLIPDTDTPGAKAAQANRFIDLLLSASGPETQKEYLQALAWFDGYCLAQHGRPFIQLDSSRQVGVLTLFTHENRDAHLAHAIRLFNIVKSSIVDTYYSSEIGLLRELRCETNPFQSDYPGCKHGDGEH